MADTFHITGDDVYFRGYLIATLATDTPATIRDAAEAALDAYHPDAIDPEEHDAALKENEEELYAALADQAREYEVDLEAERAENAGLRRQIETLDAELDAADAELENLEAEIARLEARENVPGRVGL